MLEQKGIHRMKRFLLLYWDTDYGNCYAEGLIHFDETVYVRAFRPDYQDKHFKNIAEFKSELYGNGVNFVILMIDKDED